jgi:hypothetical protein
MLGPAPVVQGVCEGLALAGTEIIRLLVVLAGVDRSEAMGIGLGVMDRTVVGGIAIACVNEEAALVGWLVASLQHLSGHLCQAKLRDRLVREGDTYFSFATPDLDYIPDPTRKYVRTP